MSPLAVRAVAWNPTLAPTGRVRAVADVGDIVAVFGDAGVTVLSAGAVVANDRSVNDWVEARTIRGADGAEPWIVGVDGRGGLYHLRGLTALDDVSARYGLDGRPVRGLAMLDANRVGFLLDGQVAVADRDRVTRYKGGPWTMLSGGGGSAVGVAEGALLVFDASTLIGRTYALPGVTSAAVDADGRLYASTPRALYASTEAGDLALVYDAERGTLHGLAVSGKRVWFADGSELGIVEGRAVAETHEARVAADARLVPSPSGDVWVLAGGSLQRFAEAAPEAPAAWSSTLAPIFARVCASCHQPGGVSGVDLSTATAWDSERDAIRDRVVASKTMPPEGHPLTAADRAAIGVWVGRTAQP